MKKIIKNIALLNLLVISFHAAAAAQSKDTGKTRAGIPAPVQTTTPSAQQIAQSGSIENSVYKNKLLGFSLTIPNGWEFTSEEANKATLQAGRDMAVESVPELKEGEIDRSIARTSVLFQIFTVEEIGSQPVAQLSCGVESPQTVGLKAEAYLEDNKQYLLSAAPDSKITRDMYRSDFGGLVFFSFDIDLLYGGKAVRQTYHITRHKDVMFFFILNYHDDSAKEMMKKAMDTMAVEKK